MRHLISQSFSLVRQSLPHLPRYAVIGAWFFAIVSAILLIWLMLEGHGSDGSSQVFGVSINGVLHTVWGLSYTGFFGTVLLWLEFLALGVAIALTALPNNFKFTRAEMTTRLRRAGLGYLTGWAGLWMLGTMYLASMSPGFWIIQALFITTLFACTVYRTVRDWNGRRPIDNHDMGRSNASSEMVHPPVEPVPSPHTDVADVTRFVLHRSAVRHSDRMTERELDEFERPARMFAARDTSPHTALDDDYGAMLRKRTQRAARFARDGVWAGFNCIKRNARTVLATLHNASRTTRSA